MKRSYIRAKPRPESEKVTPEQRLRILARDQDCVALRLDPDAGPCQGRLTIDHVKKELRSSKRAKSVDENLVCLCQKHHQGYAYGEVVHSGGHVWATANRGLIRDYLRKYQEDVPF